MPERYLCFCLDHSCGPNGKAVSAATLYRLMAADRESTRILVTSGYAVDQELLDAIEAIDKRQRRYPSLTFISLTFIRARSKWTRQIQKNIHLIVSVNFPCLHPAQSTDTSAAHA